MYVQRDEEKAKVKTKIMVTTMQKSNFQKNVKPPSTTPKHEGRRDRGKAKNRTPVKTKSQEHS